MESCYARRYVIPRILSRISQVTNKFYKCKVVSLYTNSINNLYKVINIYGLFQKSIDLHLLHLVSSEFKDDFFRRILFLSIHFIFSSCSCSKKSENSIFNNIILSYSLFSIKLFEELTHFDYSRCCRDILLLYYFKFTYKYACRNI